MSLQLQELFLFIYLYKRDDKNFYKSNPVCVNIQKEVRVWEYKIGWIWLDGYLAAWKCRVESVHTVIIVSLCLFSLFWTLYIPLSLLINSKLLLTRIRLNDTLLVTTAHVTLFHSLLNVLTNWSNLYINLFATSRVLNSTGWLNCTVS